MKKKLPLPLSIDCTGLDEPLIINLATLLRRHFRNVEIWHDEIVAAEPFSGYHYEAAWLILDRFDVRVA